MAASLPRPNSKGPSSKGTLWPALGPETTCSLVGLPLSARRDRRDCLGGFAGFGCFPPVVAAFALPGAFVPKISVRTTDTTDKTNSHRTSKKPSLIRVRVSSDTGSLLGLGDVLGRHVQHDKRVAQLESAAVDQRRLPDPATVENVAIGRTQILDADIRCLVSVDGYPGMLAWNTRIVDAKIGVRTASDGDARRRERVAHSVDFKDDIGLADGG